MDAILAVNRALLFPEPSAICAYRTLAVRPAPQLTFSSEESRQKGEVSKTRRGFVGRLGWVCGVVTLARREKKNAVGSSEGYGFTPGGEGSGPIHR